MPATAASSNSSASADSRGHHRDHCRSRTAQPGRSPQRHTRIRGPRPFQMQRLGMRRSRARRLRPVDVTPRLSSPRWERRTASGAPPRPSGEHTDPGRAARHATSASRSNAGPRPNDPYTTLELTERAPRVSRPHRGNTSTTRSSRKRPSSCCILDRAVVSREAERQALRLTGPLWSGGLAAGRAGSAGAARREHARPPGSRSS